MPLMADFLELVRQMCAKAIHDKNELPEIITKTAAFLSKTAVFLVAGGGFEPPTSGLCGRGEMSQQLYPVS